MLFLHSDDSIYGNAIRVISIMKICFVSHASNYHTKKWADWFANRGHEVHVISFSYEEIPGVYVHSLSSNVGARDNDLKKLG